MKIMIFSSIFAIAAPDLDPYEAVSIGDFQFVINTTAAMSPTSRLLVYYIRSDGEVVSASTKFKMEPTFENQVGLCSLLNWPYTMSKYDICEA